MTPDVYTLYLDVDGRGGRGLILTSHYCLLLFRMLCVTVFDIHFNSGKSSRAGDAALWLVADAALWLHD